MSMQDQRSEQDVRKLLRSLIFELAPGDAAPPAAEAADGVRLVEDLSYHSLALLELAFTIEDEFDLDPIDEEAAQQIRTVRDVGDLVVEKLAQADRLAAADAGSQP